MKKFENELNSPSDGKAHDIQRECQETEKSISDYFKVVAETAVKSGLAVWMKITIQMFHFQKQFIVLNQKES
jgi:hypothetical protein